MVSKSEEFYQVLPTVSCYHFRERLIRLQHENKMLKLQRAASEDDQSQVLQTMIEDTNRRNSELESECRYGN